jgi:hypothetical protein
MIRPRKLRAKIPALSTVLTTHHIAPAPSDARCWCGKVATITRTTPEVTSHYCVRHWMLWLQYVTRDLEKPTAASTTSLAFAIPTLQRGESHASSDMAVAMA